MMDNNIDDLLRNSARAPHPVDPALVDRIARSLAADLRPVRPLPPARFLVSGLLLVWAAVAVTGAAVLGFFGIRRLDALEIAVIFPVLALFALAAAMSSVAEMTPGSLRRVPSAWLPLIGIGVLTAVFAALFHDYRVERFVHQGLVCLIAGLVHAVAAGGGTWLVLRRGFAVSPATAGLVTGTLASLAGVTMLELHCPNLQAPHILVWHTAVIPLSAAAGALLGWVLDARRKRTPA